MASDVNALIASERRKLQDRLIDKGVLVIDKNGIASNADKDNRVAGQRPSTSYATGREACPILS